MDGLTEVYARGLGLDRDERKEVATLFRLAADFLEHAAPPPALANEVAAA